MIIAIAGATGTVGRHITRAALARGHEVRLLSRREGVDVAGGEGLDAALDGSAAVIDALGTSTLSQRKAVAFFSTTTRNLLAAEQRHGIGHHLALSIVGIDGIDTAYYAGKLAQERLVAAGPVPHTIARTTQFHEFAEQIAVRAALGPIVLAPRTLTRPVAAREVGVHLVELAEAGPSGRAPDLIGPRDETLVGMIRRMHAHDGIRRPVIDWRMPGAYGAGLASGALRGGSAADAPQRVGAQTFDAWLDAPEHRR
ncbi:NAD(P)H-binding protein [Schumannella luteola]|uniref:Uncharacterized protein YbjT (DUF2867 family) n=1 Tax=Schumannella luteola TaxID=472059 RepID=A0A852Y7S1_9MICO|nr:NAD(P)H-binding protein [Schumannella luteola]NYG97430.1 uncharacterized protein YbjT (DUF2867 family) [Schumannella luteola]TPX01674.1 NAD-dependent epimerase/dehydratase family protein [Schumannella luteola]